MKKKFVRTVKTALNISMAVIFLTLQVSCTESELKAEEKFQNRLRFEKSPYLLQHATNPIDWYPWGEEAFEKARKENKPIFLSIGYSTCHWCHVMEREVFSDEEAAKVLNDAFVMIKVDREERPDIDAMYMKVAQMMTGSGGWPLNIVMTPDKKPFYAATYIPKNDRFGRPGIMTLVPRIKEVWETKHEDVLKSADNIASVLQRSEVANVGAEIDVEGLKTAYQRILADYDEVNGGFGQSPKFPLPHKINFLLRYWKRTGDQKSLEMVEKTLREMRLGGIYDQVGFGFHRYSTDAEWLVPHFEKMLYNQSMHALAYTEAYQATGNPEYRKTAEEIFTYVLRDMTSKEGGFYSAEDADSEEEEGKFTLWNFEQIKKILNEEEANLIIKVFNLEESGNFIDTVTHEKEKDGGNILHLKKPVAELAADMDMDAVELERRVESARNGLFKARELRIHPYKDDKVLADWNGLMIAALAKAARVFDDPKYLTAAEKAAGFVLTKMRDKNGRILHRYRGGEAHIVALADDYAFLVWGFLELYESSFDIKHLKAALELNGDFIKHFWDEKDGGFFFTADDGEKLLVRQKDGTDGPVPSANSVAMLNMLRLGRITADVSLEEKSARIGRLFSNMAVRAPSFYTQMLSAADFGIGPSYEVVISGDPQSADTKKLIKALRTEFVPNKVVILRPDGKKEPEITKIAEYTKNQVSIGGKATAYVCLNYNCNLPTTDVNEMVRQLKAGKVQSAG